MKTPVYLDNQSTTAVDPVVLAEMLPFFGEAFGNAASHSHGFGWEAREAVERARERVAAAIGARPEEIVFTSGATESDNTALAGLVGGARERGDHVVTAATEHRAVLDPLARLEREGVRVTRLGVDAQGLVDPADVERAITSRTVLVTLMAANNEVGTIHPLEDVGRIARRRGVPFHSDAAQALGKVPLDVEASCLDAASLSAHKLHGPKGVGALYLRRDPAVALEPLMLGGGHEGGRRPGTPNVPGIVGFGKAVEIACAGGDDEPRRLRALRDRLLGALQARIDGVRLNGHATRRLPNNLNLSFDGIDGEALLAALHDVVALSAGSACMSATREPSYVLGAMGLSEERVRGAVRFGLGRFNTADEVDFVAGEVARAVRRLRDLAPPGRARVDRSPGCG